jgi:hypothetical protein
MQPPQKLLRWVQRIGGYRSDGKALLLMVRRVSTATTMMPANVEDEEGGHALPIYRSLLFFAGVWWHPLGLLKRIHPFVACSKYSSEV